MFVYVFRHGQAEEEALGFLMGQKNKNRSAVYRYPLHSSSQLLCILSICQKNRVFSYQYTTDYVLLLLSDVVCSVNFFYTVFK
jgi:hypothetical protein